MTAPGKTGVVPKSLERRSKAVKQQIKTLKWLRNVVNSERDTMEAVVRLHDALQNSECVYKFV